MSVNPRKLLELVATKNNQYGHSTPQQELFLKTLHGHREENSRKERRINKAKALENMGLIKPEFEVPEVIRLITDSEKIK